MGKNKFSIMAHRDKNTKQIKTDRDEQLILCRPVADFDFISHTDAIRTMNRHAMSPPPITTNSQLGSV